MFKYLPAFLLIAIALLACKDKPVNKPRGYFKINFPKRQYQVFNKADYPYSFEYPVYATVVKDTTFLGGATENPWWINVVFPDFNGKIYISYKEIGKYKLDTLLRHVFKLTDVHDQKATGKEDLLINNTVNNVHGLLFDVSGDVATNNQFFVTDSTKHFLRGAMYFEATPNQDSIKIVNDFLLEDLKHLINTFKWKSK